MSYAAFKMMHWATGIENCAAGFITHSPADLTAQIQPIHSVDPESEWPAKRRIGPIPNVAVTAANVLELYIVRVHEDDGRSSELSGDSRSGGIMDDLRGARLEFVCNYRLHGNIDSMAIVSSGGDERSKTRDSIVLSFQDAKITVLEYDDSAHELRTSSMHCFEGPDWHYLKRGRESFSRGPTLKADPLGRCCGALVYGLQMVIMKASQAGQGLAVDEEPSNISASASVHIDSSYIINLRDLDMKHVKDFTFVHGYIEPVLVVLQEKEPTWAGRIAWKHHTCMISALSISTTLKQHPLIWSASNLPHDAYKLLSVPSPLGGVIVLCANSIHYHSQSITCLLGLNGFAAQLENSMDMPKSTFTVELDAANATWLSHDVAMLSSKTGELLLLTLVNDGRVVQRLDLVKSKASVLTSSITTLGSSFFFLGSRLGDSLLVQYSCGTSLPTSVHAKEEVTDVDGDAPLAKKLRMSSDSLQDFSSSDELSLFSTAPNSSESTQKFFTFAVRDSLINVGPIKDFAYGLRINANSNVTGISKQSNYELSQRLLPPRDSSPWPANPSSRTGAPSSCFPAVSGASLGRQLPQQPSLGRLLPRRTDTPFSLPLLLLRPVRAKAEFFSDNPSSSSSRPVDFVRDLLGFHSTELEDVVLSSNSTTDNILPDHATGDEDRSRSLTFIMTSDRSALATSDHGKPCTSVPLCFIVVREDMFVILGDAACTIEFYEESLISGLLPPLPLEYSLLMNLMTLDACFVLRVIHLQVCCSGHGKNGALSVMQHSVELPGCKGIWTVYHKSSRGLGVDALKTPKEDDEFHAYLIISLESRTMVLETADDLGEVTENVDYYVQGSTIAAGNLFGRRRVVQVFARGARILDGSYMTQELSFGVHNSDHSSTLDSSTVSSASIADPYVLLKMVDGSIQLLIGDLSACTVSICIPSILANSTDSVSACTLYTDKGPDFWLRKASTDAWLSSGIAEAIDGNDGSYHEQEDIYCLVCYESGALEIYDVPNFKCVFSVSNFASGKAHLVDRSVKEPFKSCQKLKSRTSNAAAELGRKETPENMKAVELVMQRWSGPYCRPFIFAILNDGTILCYHAYLYEGPESSRNEEVGSPNNYVDLSSVSTSRFRNLRFIRVPTDYSTRVELANVVIRPKIAIFKNIAGYQGLFLSGSRPAWFMVCRERLRVHPQLCDASIAAFTVLHNVNCNHGFIYVTSQGFLKICQLPSAFNYDNYWPVRKIPLRGTPHQVTYCAEKNLYPLILSFPHKLALNQVVQSVTGAIKCLYFTAVNFEVSDDVPKTYTLEDFEVRILEPEKSGGNWETKASIPMQPCENALTVRMVTLFNSTTKENEALLAIGTTYVQGEDVSARGRILLFSIGKNSESSQNLVTEVYSKELKGSIPALASLQGHLLIASGTKITLHKWTGSELNGVAFYDAPLYVVSLNIVKNFILLGDIHKSIYFLNWKEQGAQLSLLAKDFGSLDCYATEFLIDGSTLSLVVSDDQKNVQIFYYAPKMLESWKGQKLLSRAEFHVGAHVSKFLRLQMLPTSSDRATPGSDKTNRFALLFATLDGSIGCIAPLDELTFRRLQTLQRKLVDSVPHTCGLNPRSFRQFRSNGKPHHPGPDNIVDCELLSQYEMLSLEEQLEIANQIGTTRAQILANLNDFSLSTSFL
ncbi:Cleavage and polyadenylation specificity factor subunit 1 [Platanthera guangdongensis]|uniref:Cleavage and polyadenylation specificity factor subunit 1 n=1 Tax=Platanthera guangdongensis TaxID=2320717 RepID=A0ABR2MLT3_9ASPA